jgi:hypothetical protein
MNEPRLKKASGRRKGQASRRDYKGKHLEQKLNLAIFGKVANKPLFYEVLESIAWESSRQLREEAVPDVISLLSEDPEFDPADVDFYKKLILHEKVSKNSNTEEFLSLEAEIFRHIDPELLEVSHDMMAIATGLLMVTDARPLPDELREQVRGAKIVDPIRFWIIRAHAELFDELKRPPSGQELSARYPEVAKRFPFSSPSKSDAGDNVFGEENLRKTIGDVDLWMLDEKFIQAILSAHKKFHSAGKVISGESLWDSLSENRKSRESIENWTFEEFVERLPNLAICHHPKNPAQEPLLGNWLMWLALRGSRLHTLRAHIEGLTEMYHDSENSCGHSELSSETVSEGRNLIHGQLRWEEIESLSMTHNQLCEHMVGGNVNVPVTMGMLTDSNRLLKKMIRELTWKFVEKIAFSRGR